MSDLPVWIGALANATSVAVNLSQGVRSARDKAATEFARLLDQMLELSAEEIEEALGHERLAQLVGSAWEAASRTASEKKRWMLAGLAAAALRGETDDAIVDPLPLYLRTVAAVDEPHLRLLALVANAPRGEAQRNPAAPEGSLSAQELQEQWPGARRFVKTILAVLVREGLIEDRALGAVNYGEPLYGVTDYGREFLGYLPEGDTTRTGDRLT